MAEVGSQARSRLGKPQRNQVMGHDDGATPSKEGRFRQRREEQASLQVSIGEGQAKLRPQQALQVTARAFVRRHIPWHAIAGKALNLPSR